MPSHGEQGLESHLDQFGLGLLRPARQTDGSHAEIVWAGRSAGGLARFNSQSFSDPPVMHPRSAQRHRWPVRDWCLDVKA